MKRFAMALLLLVMVASPAARARSQSAEPGLTGAEKRARHAVERLTFGPRPGEVNSVAALGVDRWIELQLHPDRIDDTAMEMRLAAYRTLLLSTRDLVLDFPSYDLLKAAMNGKLPMPGDPYRHAVYSAGMARLQMQEEEKKAVAAALALPPTSPPTAAVEGNTSGKDKTSSAKPEANQPPKDDRHPAHTPVDDLIPLEPEARMQRILSLPAREQAVLLKGLPGAKRQALPEIVLDWIELGCLVQVTANAITGFWGAVPQKMAAWLLKKGAVHFIGSDAHDPLHRTPLLRKARQAAAAIVGEEKARFLVQDNPLAVVQGERLPYGLPSGLEPKCLPDQAITVCM